MRNNIIREKQKGLKILIFNWRDIKHTWAGGAECYVHELAKRWVKNGHEVTVFCGNDKFCKKEEIIDGVKIIRRGGMYTVYAWAVFYYIFKLRRGVDIIVDSENGTPFFTPLFSTKPIILLIHHVHKEIFTNHLRFPFSYIARFIEGRLMPIVYRKNTVVTVSQSTKDEIVKAKLAQEQDIFIVNPGVNIYPAKIIKTKHPTVIYLGRLKAYKNIDVAIKAFSRISKKIPRAKFYIVGEGECDRELYELSEGLGLHSQILFYGKVSEKRKVKLLSQSWLALQPSSLEGWGITVLEANAYKTPVIASNTNGLKDSIVHGKTGVLVRTKDVGEFSKAMLFLFQNKKKRVEISEASYRWAQQFSWDTSAEKFYLALTNVLSKKKSIIPLPKLTYITNRITSLF